MVNESNIRHFEDLSDLERKNLATIIKEIENDPKKTHKLRSYLRDQGIRLNPSHPIAKALGFKEQTKEEGKRNLNRLVRIRRV